jgi:hypothetical protein
MKLYCTTGEKRISPSVVKTELMWSGTERGATADRKYMKQSLECEFIETTPIAFPTDKEGLLDFLNAHKVLIGD